jgi:hypothetical protein
MRRISLGGMALLAALAVTACGDSPTDALGDLSQEEAEALAEVVGQTVFSTWTEAAAPAHGMAPVAALIIESDVAVEAPCPLGGQVAISGALVMDIDEATEDVTLDYSLTQVHQSCSAASEDGIVFTLDGAPNITADLFLESIGDALSMTGGYSGAVDWITGERAGNCSLSVEFSVQLNPTTEAGSGSISGTVCGTNFTQTMSFS